MKIFAVAATTDAATALQKLLQGYGKVVAHTVGTAETEQSVSAVLADIRSADAFVAEMSDPGQALGFAIAYANLHFVPCLYMHRPSHKPDPLFLYNPSRKLLIKQYDDSSAQRVVQDFMITVERQMETARTSFMSTKEIDAFVAKESDARGISKGEVIRQALSKIAKSTQQQ